MKSQIPIKIAIKVVTAPEGGDFIQQSSPSRQDFGRENYIVSPTTASKIIIQSQPTTIVRR
jgi:hypothetical protein